MASVDLNKTAAAALMKKAQASLLDIAVQRVSGATRSQMRARVMPSMMFYAPALRLDINTGAYADYLPEHECFEADRVVRFALALGLRIAVWDEEELALKAGRDADAIRREIGATEITTLSFYHPVPGMGALDIGSATLVHGNGVGELVSDCTDYLPVTMIAAAAHCAVLRLADLDVSLWGIFEHEDGRYSGEERDAAAAMLGQFLIAEVCGGSSTLSQLRAICEAEGWKQILKALDLALLRPQATI